MELPNFAGPQLPIAPPFFFKNMTAAVFPLRARFDSLERFCQGYLNIIPEQLGRFRPMVPYVYLMMLDYGGLAVQARNLGWFAQHEVMFCIPVEWYKVVDGQWVFHDWATVAPFIYVDDPLSMTLGRTLLGWPKSLVQLSPRLTGWMRDPSGPTREATITAKVFDRAYADASMEERPILEIRRAPASGLEFPFNPDGRGMPWVMLTNMARNLSSAASLYAGALKGMGLMPWHRGTSVENYSRMAERAAGMMFPFAPNATANTINLKQFRRSDAPAEYSFQALTNGPMRLTSFNRGALLGEAAMWMGDLSGGYTIDLAHWPLFPIVETLGIEADMVISLEGLRVSRLKPFMPFWYDVDMQYTQGSNIAWRGPDGCWRDQEGTYYPHHSSVAGNDRAFNTLGGAGAQVITGPFRFPSAALFVLPLLAHRDVLQKLLDESLNEPLSDGHPSTGERFDVWGASDEHAYIYMVAAQWGCVSSETNDVGDWAHLGVTFYVPVKREVHGQLTSVGLFAAQALADGTTQACTMSELYGIQTSEGEFHVPSAPFASGGGTVGQEPRSLLSIRVEVLPTLGEGQETQRRQIIDIRDGGGRAFTEAETLGDSAEAFCRLLRREVARKNAVAEDEKALGRVCALELLAQRRPIEVYTLKQFRDGSTPMKACVQSLVQIPYTIDEIHAIEEITDPIRVEIADYPSLPIAHTLGLVTRSTQTSAGATTRIVEAVRPFWLRASIGLANGVRLYHRTDMQWHVGTREPTPQLAPGPRALTAELEAYISRSAPVQIGRTVAEWLEHQPSDALARVVSLDVDAIDPQTVLESILSREWEDRSTTSRRTRTREALARELEDATSGTGSWINDSLHSIRGRRQLSGAERELCLRMAALEHLLLALYEVDVDVPSEERLKAAWRRWETAQNAGGVVAAMLDVVVSSPELLQLKGEVRSLDEDGFAGARAQRELCIALVRGILRSIAPAARRVVEAALDEVVVARRKPDHCVLRSTGGREREHLFPLRDSYAETWYAGPQGDLT